MTRHFKGNTMTNIVKLPVNPNIHHALSEHNKRMGVDGRKVEMQMTPKGCIYLINGNAVTKEELLAFFLLTGQYGEKETT